MSTCCTPLRTPRVKHAATLVSLYQALADQTRLRILAILADLPDEDQRDVQARVRALFRGAAGPDGMYRYRFVKVFAVAVKPG